MFARHALTPSRSADRTIGNDQGAIAVPDILRSAIDMIRGVSARWRKTSLVVAGIVACEIGTRIVAPSLNSQVVRDYFRGSGGMLLELYDWIAGGALSRGAVLALGIMPYVSARIILRL